jgi:hypothetical protein
MLVGSLAATPNARRLVSSPHVDNYRGAGWLVIKHQWGGCAGVSHRGVFGCRRCLTMPSAVRATTSVVVVDVRRHLFPVCEVSPVEIGRVPKGRSMAERVRAVGLGTGEAAITLPSHTACSRLTPRCGSQCNLQAPGRRRRECPRTAPTSRW